MISSNINHFEQFQRQRRDNQANRARNEESVSLLLSSFGNDIYELNEKFFEQGIEFRDLASLNREDLQQFGVKDHEKQTQMLETFSELSKQDYSLNEIKKSKEAQKYNSQIIENASLYLDTMRLSLAATNLKLKLKPSGDIIVDEKSFASKFVLDALSELQNVTNDIEKELKNLEEICDVQKETKKSGNMISYVAFGTITILCVSIIYWKLR